MLFLAVGAADWGVPNCPLSQNSEGVGRGRNGAKWVNSEWVTHQAQGLASLRLGWIATGWTGVQGFPPAPAFSLKLPSLQQEG